MMIGSKSNTALAIFKFDFITALMVDHEEYTVIDELDALFLLLDDRINALLPWSEISP